VQSGPVLLHDHRSDDVLERSPEFRQLIQALLDDVGCPLIDFVVLVRVAADRVFNRLLYDVADVVDDEGSFLGCLEIIHGLFFFQN